MDIADSLSLETRNQDTLTQQLDQQLTWLIARGDLRPGDLLPSVRQLAERLGISINTVRAAYARLEAGGLVETRQGIGTRVLAQDAQRFVQIAAATRSYTVGIIIPSLANPFYHPFLDGVEEMSRRDGTMLFVCNTRDDASGAWRYFAQLAAKHVDGIIVASHDTAGFQTPGTTGRGESAPLLALVTVDWPGAAGYSVGIDLEDAGFQATQHLLGHGHRRVGLITYHREEANVAPVNAGYRRALEEAGINVDSELIARVPAFDMAAGSAGARQLLELAQPPTALFTIADTLALGAMSLLAGASIRVPEEVAIASFNDITPAGLLHPPLTTVHAPSHEMGAQAMRMLQDLIAGRKPARKQVLLPAQLIIRQSCGAHP